MNTDEDTFNRSLGRRIRSARKRKGMNQEALAALINVGRTSIVMIEKGEQRVHAHLIVSLATVLGVPVNELLGLVESTPASPATSTLPRSRDARNWVMGGLTQPIVVTAGDADEEDALGDGIEDQGRGKEVSRRAGGRNPAVAGGAARAIPRAGAGDAAAKRR